MLNTVEITVGTKVRVNYKRLGDYWWGRVAGIDGDRYTIQYGEKKMATLEYGVKYHDIIGTYVNTYCCFTHFIIYHFITLHYCHAHTGPQVLRAV